MTSLEPRHLTDQRIVVLGAAGIAGQRATETLVARGARPPLAGRDPAKLETLAASLGVDADVEQTDVNDYASADLGPVSS